LLISTSMGTTTTAAEEVSEEPSAPKLAQLSTAANVVLIIECSTASCVDELNHRCVEPCLTSGLKIRRKFLMFTCVKVTPSLTKTVSSS